MKWPKFFRKRGVPGPLPSSEISFRTFPDGQVELKVTWGDFNSEVEERQAALGLAGFAKLLSCGEVLPHIKSEIAIAGDRCGKKGASTLALHALEELESDDLMIVPSEVFSGGSK